MSVCEGEGLGCRSRVCARQAPLSEDQGREPGGYGTKMDGQGGGIGSSFELAKALVRGYRYLNCRPSRVV